MNRILTASLSVALLLGADITVAQTPPRAVPADSDSRITPNFRDVPIEQLADAVGQATNKTFIVAPNVRAQVSLINPRPMTPTELYYAFLSILQVHGFAAVPSGNVVKIVQDTNARQLPGNDLPPSLNIGTDEMVTTVIEVKNINANQLSTVLRQLMSANSFLQPVQGTNSLVITDRAANVRRIQKIIERVDQTSTNGIDVIRLENRSAGELARVLERLTAGQQAEAAAGLVPRIVADEGSNSILVSGDPAQRLRVAAYVANLDTPREAGGTETRYLKYADAEKVQAKLKEQATGIQAAGAAGAPPAAAAAAAGTGDRNVTIVAYKETNALIITAPPKMMRELWAIVDKLDIPRAQVFIEAVIADVNTNKSRDLGVNWAAFSKEDGANVPAGGFISPVGGVNIVDLTRSVLNPTGAGATAPLGATFGIGRISDTGFNFAAMLRALAMDDTSNIIATPTITTIDNQPAEFNDAQGVPFITGQYTNTGGNNNGNVNPFTTVQREDVGTILKITPQINDANTLTLAIELESSGLAGKLGDAGSAITNKRSFKTTVRVENGATLVVAGMIRNAKTNTENRVPFLSRIPLIGQAFKVRNGTRVQQNLMVFIRPRIVTDGVQATVETNQKYDFMREQQRSMGDKSELIPLFPFDKSPQLPPLQQPPAAPPPASTTPVPAPGEPATKQ
jgi:general secretion pathway protein D